MIEANARNLQSGPAPWLCCAPTSQVWGQWSFVWQSFYPVLRRNTDSEWSQRSDVTTAARRNNKEEPFRMGRSEVREKPEGNSESEEPKLSHTHTKILITWLGLGQISYQLRPLIWAMAPTFLCFFCFLMFSYLIAVWILLSSENPSKSLTELFIETSCFKHHTLKLLMIVLATQGWQDWDINKKNM